MIASGMVQAAENTYLVSGSNTNWVLIAEGDELTLVDGGYPADAAALEESVREIGHRMQDVRAVLVTHAHVDHIGSLPYLVDRYRMPVCLDPVEVRHARREYLEQVSPARILGNGWRPGVLPWALHAVRAGGLRTSAVPSAEPFPAGGALDLPGRPVPVATPGHTSGHTSYHLPDRGVVITGDTLITGHPASRLAGPQFLLPMFNHEGARTVRALEALEGLDAEVLLPGHGPAHRGPVARAVAIARERASSSRQLR